MRKTGENQRKEEHERDGARMALNPNAKRMNVIHPDKSQRTAWIEDLHVCIAWRLMYARSEEKRETLADMLGERKDDSKESKGRA